MRKIIILFIIFISVNCFAFTGYDYAPMEFGSWIKYARYKIKTSWDNNTMELSVVSREYLDVVKVIDAPYRCLSCFGNAVLYRHVFPDYNSLVDGGSVVDGQEYIGEAVNSYGNIHIPFIAKLAKHPYCGQVISAISKVIASCGFCDAHMINHPWTYRTIDHYNQWGAYEDCWRTSLIEHNQNYQYNYVWAKDIGCIHFWYSIGDNTGYEFYAIDWSI